MFLFTLEYGFAVSLSGKKFSLILASPWLDQFVHSLLILCRVIVVVFFWFCFIYNEFYFWLEFGFLQVVFSLVNIQAMHIGKMVCQPNKVFCSTSWNGTISAWSFAHVYNLTSCSKCIIFHKMFVFTRPKRPQTRPNGPKRPQTRPNRPNRPKRPLVRSPITLSLKQKTLSLEQKLRLN